ncbi:calcium/calmodulin-dependent protein kinase I [[Candida] jaroonii]|uniref:Calcium/calmodulin-dependent protein kinase I n=1 Tax=[Candida] jaroonii TaxID=467808 RepID=A0ACA9YBG2_9ASCO|nr:calcium/calmodulin-dependent protein kinase I [[Candida] jaroonii]
MTTSDEIWPPTSSTNIKRNQENKFDLPCNYTICKKPIGQGSYSVVFECKNTLTSKHYAGKRYTKKLMFGMEPMLQNEFEVLKTVSRNNSHLLTLVDYFETEKYIFLITDLAKGGELHDKILNKMCLKEFETANITSQILDTLCYLKENNIVHRDLKAENVLFQNNHSSEILIADFGLSKILNGDKLTGKCGTLSYMAPEMFSQSYDYQIDIWALGVLVYFMLCGYFPFDCETDDETMDAIKSADYRFDPPEYWDHISAEAKDFLSKCFKVDPTERITCHEALDHPFLNSLNRSSSSMSLINKLRESLVTMKSSSNLNQLRNGSYNNLANLNLMKTSLSQKSLSGTMSNTMLNPSGSLSEILSGTLSGALCESPEMISRFTTPLTSANVSRVQSWEKMDGIKSLTSTNQTHEAVFQI